MRMILLDRTSTAYRDVTRISFACEETESWFDLRYMDGRIGRTKYGIGPSLIDGFCTYHLDWATGIYVCIPLAVYIEA